VSKSAKSVCILCILECLLLSPSFFFIPSSKASPDPAWDFEDHTYHHYDLTTLNTIQIITELAMMNSTFQAHGLPLPEHLAYPLGTYNTAVISVVSANGRLSGRTTGAHQDPDVPPVQWYSMDAKNIASTTTVDHVKGWIDRAVAIKGLLNLFTHDVRDQPNQYGTTPAVLEQVLDYLVSEQAAGNLTVMTIHQAYTGYTGGKAVVVMSFDDGWITDYTTVWPMFTARGLAGTSYIIGSGIDVGGPNTLTWGMIDEMAQVTPPPWPLVILSNPPAGGSTTPPSGTYSVSQNPFAVTASPAAGYVFTGWQFDGNPSIDNPILLTPQSNTVTHYLTANYAPVNVAVSDVFHDRFETGLFNAWSSVTGSASIVSSPVNSGSYAAQATGPNADWEKNLGVGYSDLFFSGYIHVPSRLAKGQQALFLYILDGSYNYKVAGGLQTDSSGSAHWVLRVNNNWYYSIAFSLQTDHWYFMEIEYNTAGTANLFVDSTLVRSVTGQTLSSNAQVLEGGNPFESTPSGYLSYGDDYKAATGYITESARALHDVVFTESGLTSGTSWSMTFYGNTKHSTGNTIAFSGVLDGTYLFSVLYPSGYSCSPSSGSITVSAAGVIQNVAFTKNSAWDFEDHTYTHTDLTTLTAIQVDDELQQMNTVFQNHGLPLPQHLAYPDGVTNSAVQAEVSKYRLSGRIGDAPSGMATYPVSSNTWYALPALNIAADMNFNVTHDWQYDIKWWIDTAIASKQLLCVYTHDVTDSPSTYGCTPTILNQVLDYLVEQQDVGQLYVMTMRDAYNLYDGQTAVVVVGFDNCTATDYSMVWPMFQSHSLVGTSYVIGDAVGQPGHLTWSMITQMAGHDVVFTESGLASGTSWNVTFNGNTQASSGNTVTFSGISDGTYSFSVLYPSGYSCSPSSGSITVSAADVSQDVTFTQDEYTLTVHTVGSGSVVKSPNQATYHYGDVVQLTAIANAGYTFTAWSGDASSTNSEVGILIDGDKSVTANFTQIEYTLTVNVSGQGGTNATGTFPHNAFTNVTILATPASGYFFDHWTLNGSDAGSMNPYTINMTANYELTGVFLPVQRTLTVAVSGNGVTNATGIHTYDEYSNVTVLATPSSGYFFDHWVLNGSSVGSANPYTINMTANYDLTAVFSAVQRTLTVSVVGGGATNATGTQSYNEFTNVTVLATPDSGWKLDHWTLNGTLYGPTSSFTINMTANYDLTAVFTPIQYSLTVTVDGQGITNSTGTFTHNAFTNVTVLATPDSGYFLDHWTLNGTNIGSVNPYTINMTANYDLTAVFLAVQRSLTVTVIGHGVTNVTGTQAYDEFTNVTVLATPDFGYKMDHWVLNGSIVGSVNPYTLNMTANFDLTAVFTPIEYNLFVGVVGHGVTNVTGTQTYAAFTDVTVLATPDSGYYLFEWLLNGSSVGSANPYTVSMINNYNLTAMFAPIQFSLTVNVSGQGSTNATGTFMHDVFTNVTVLATPASGYFFDYWILNGTNAGSMNPYTINMTDNYNLTAVFTHVQVSLTVEVSGQGATNRTGTFAYDQFTNVTVLATPDSGYFLDYWLLNGTNAGSQNPYTLNMTANYNLTAVFTRIQYSLTVSVSGHGSTNATGVFIHDAFTNVTVLATSDPGWTLDHWTLNGTLYGPTSSFTINMTANYDLTAVFTPIQYSMTVSAGANGQITPATGSVNYGDTPTYTITPDTGYHIVNITVNGQSVDVTNSTGQTYQFSPITGDSSISATFAINKSEDINGDGIVDVIDLNLLGRAYGSTPSSPNWNANADLNSDNIINGADLQILILRYGSSPSIDQSIHIHLTWQNPDMATTMTATWQTTQSITGNTVKYNTISQSNASFVESSMLSYALAFIALATTSSRTILAIIPRRTKKRALHTIHLEFKTKKKRAQKRRARAES
jgi:uncharacterized repeat protein (TIGR02543 family)